MKSILNLPQRPESEWFSSLALASIIDKAALLISSHTAGVSVTRKEERKC